MLVKENNGVSSGGELPPTSRIKTVRAGERDCPQENQAQHASTDFGSKTD